MITFVKKYGHFFEAKSVNSLKDSKFQLIVMLSCRRQGAMTIRLGTIHKFSTSNNGAL